MFIKTPLKSDRKKLKLLCDKSRSTYALILISLIYFGLRVNVSAKPNVFI